MMRRFRARRETLEIFGQVFNSAEEGGVSDKPDIYPFHFASLKAQN